ncbi:MAG: cyclase family protein [Clostridiales bacterium]|jgi:kynurenine formamidase|nr:cyclase family protein [Clostridiales bacterium]
MAVKLYDLTQQIYQGMPVWPGHVRTVVWDHDTHETTVQEGGYSWASKGIMLCDHGPTHVDAISHMRADGDTIDVEPLDKFYGSGVVLDVSEADPDGYITKEILEHAEEKSGIKVEKGDTVLLYTGHYVNNYGTDQYLKRHAGLDQEATQWLVDKEVKNFGIDAPSTDNPKDRTFPSHLVTKANKLIHMENLSDLRPLLGKKFIFIGFPLNIRGGHGSPIRAVGVVEK